jgi:hypothetical protein
MVEICYILGTTRSGTSALRNALAETKFKGPGEGHLVPLLEDLLGVVYKQKTSGLGAKSSGNGLFRMSEHEMGVSIFLGYEHYLQKTYGSEFIVDKTPTIEPIKFSSHLNRFHSSAKFIHCARRHIDNIISKCRKFPEVPFEIHCREWTDCSLAWEEKKPQLNGNFIEFDYFDLVNDVIGVSIRVADYLGLSEEERNIFNNYIGVQRPEGSKETELGRVARFSDVEWTDKEKIDFMRICEPRGSQLGYGLDYYFEEFKA